MLADLVSRGLLDASAVARAVQAAPLPPLGEDEPPALVSSFGLRNLTVLNQLYEVLERLRTTGIESGQGFLFDPALSVEDLVLRHAGEGTVFAEPPARPHLRLLEPYLHRAFEGFYERLLSDPHFARHFRDQDQIRALVVKQRQTFLESLYEEPEALRERYAGLGRLHAGLGLPLATFLKGADILHEQLLEVLVHATREPSVLRDTQRFFARLRDLMALGYAERALPEARRDVAQLRSGRAGEALGPAPREAAFACVEGLLAGIERRLAARGDAAGTSPPVPAARERPAASRLAGTPAAEQHERLHADAESVAFFLSRSEYAAAFPILEGLPGRFARML